MKDVEVTLDSQQNKTLQVDHVKCILTNKIEDCISDIVT